MAPPVRPMDLNHASSAEPVDGSTYKRAYDGDTDVIDSFEPLAKRRSGMNNANHGLGKAGKENQYEGSASTASDTFATRLLKLRSQNSSPVSRTGSPLKSLFSSTFAKVDELQEALTRDAVDIPPHMMCATGDKFCEATSIFPWLGGYSAHLLALNRHTEADYLPGRDFLARHSGINATMRKKLVDWLQEVDYELSNSHNIVSGRRLFLAVNVLDRFLSSTSITISTRNLQLVGIACYRLADKFESDELDLSGAVRFCDTTFTAQEIYKMEAEVLKSIDFRLSAPTSVDFIEYYVTATSMDSANRKQKQEFQNLCSCILETTLLSHRLAAEYKPSVVAAAAVLLAQRICGLRGKWDATLELLSGSSEEQLERPASQIKDLFADWRAQPTDEALAAESMPTAFTQWRYSSARHAFVANRLCQQHVDEAGER